MALQAKHLRLMIAKKVEYTFNADNVACTKQNPMSIPDNEELTGSEEHTVADSGLLFLFLSLYSCVLLLGLLRIRKNSVVFERQQALTNFSFPMLSSETMRLWRPIWNFFVIPSIVTKRLENPWYAQERAAFRENQEYLHPQVGNQGRSLRCQPLRLRITWLPHVYPTDAQCYLMSHENATLNIGHEGIISIHSAVTHLHWLKQLA